MHYRKSISDSLLSGKEEAKGASVHTFNRRSANHQLRRRKIPQIFQQEQQHRVPKGICYPRTPSLWKSDHRLALFGQFLLPTGRRPTNPNEEYGTCGRPAAGAEPSPRHRDLRWITSKWQCTAEAGWLVSHRQRGTRALNKLGLTTTSTAKNDSGGRTENRKPRQRHRKQRQQPALPREDIKVILRPREGLDVSKVSSARLRDGVFCAIGLKEQEAEGDLLRVNPEKNIIVTSTPSMDRAKKYNSISKICIAGKTYEVTAYAAPPEDTAKGVIHNIPDYDTAEDITRSLVYNKNPTILQAQRMGKTNSAVIVFEGNKVPYYVYYRGAEYQCFLHKKKHEVCSTCGKVGHRMDVCPAPEDKICRSCGTKNPRDGHKCDPKCALCCGDHPTGDKNCKNRFQTPYLLRKRQRDRERQNGASQYGGHRNVESTSVLGGGEGGGSTKERGTRDRSGSFPRLPHRGSGSDNDAGQRQQRRSRSKSRCRSPNTQGRHQSRSTSQGGRHETPGETKQNKVSWASTVSHSSAPQDAKKKISNQTSAQQADRQQQVELTKIKQMLEMVVAENAKLKAEVAKLRGSENADKVVPETQGPSSSQAPPPDQGKANTIQPTQVPLAEDSSSDEMENSEPESPPPKRKATDTTLTNAPRLSKRAEKRDAETLQHFGEKLSEMLTSKFEAMLAKFAESIGTQIAALNARVTAIEAISPRFTGGGGGTGLMKSTKPYARPKPKKGTQLKIIEWDEFRELRAAERDSCEGKTETHEIEDIESWVEQLHTSVQKATKTIPEEAELTQADAKLLHMHSKFYGPVFTEIEFGEFSSCGRQLTLASRGTRMRTTRLEA
ncbi:hypothetical protein HPB47_007724 [Ixodes persulcatus]|uniref:Uncharacterized protein n=1 Tax=Ixodes persulcatus TaxID=34615 RepID=A0AC60P721_IXOPE|nr:hypothetical protein HPB47_007724 [Ixodes persulcatus]